VTVHQLKQQTKEVYEQQYLFYIINTSRRDDNSRISKVVVWPSNPNICLCQLEVYWKYTSFTVLMKLSQISFVMYMNQYSWLYMYMYILIT